MEEIICRFGGIVRTSRLLELGVTRHRMRMNLLAGRAIRPRVGWLAVPDCDPELIRAARVGAVLSCVTQARRLGLWEGPDRRDHLAVPVAGCESREPGVVFHYAEPIYPRERWLLEDSIINVLELVAHCQPFEVAVAVWDSALRQGKVDLGLLHRMPFRGRALPVLEHVSPYADSGLESYVRLRLRRLGVRVWPQAWVDGHQVDFLIGDRLVLQIDGGHHVGQQRMADIEHDARLQLRGYTVFRVSYVHVVDRWHEVHERLMQAVALGLHRA